MFKPFTFENENYLIHSFRPEDLNRFTQITKEVFCILSDDHTLKFVPNKRLNTLQQAEVFLQTMLMNAHAGRNYLHFITNKESGKIVGIIDLISPEVAQEHYQITHYPFFIEFYLSSFASGCYLMTTLLPPIIDQILAQGIPNIAAVVNRNNIAAKKVLKKARFSYKEPFDPVQDLYEIAIEH